MTTTMPYVYRVKAVEKVTDGDTYWLHLDVGFRNTLLAHLRLNGYDTPELNRGSAYEKEQGAIATEFVADWFTSRLAQFGSRVWVRTEKDPDNFGRWLATVWSEEEGEPNSDLGHALMANSLAVESPGGKVKWRDYYDTASTATVEEL